MLFIQQIPMKSQAFGKNTVSQNKQCYAVVTNNPKSHWFNERNTSVKSAHTTFLMHASWACSVIFTEPHTGWGRLCCCTSMVDNVRLPRLNFWDCPLALRSFSLKAMHTTSALIPLA